MISWLKPSVAERRLLPEGRSAGPMPWVIGIMMLLTTLAAAMGLAVGNASASLSNDIAGKLTIQVPEANQSTKNGQIRAILSEIRQVNAVVGVERVSDAQLAQLLDPWLGNIGADEELPMPALIDVTLSRADATTILEITNLVTGIAPKARVDRHATWLSPLASLMTALKWLAFGLVLLMASATAATVILAVRAALNTHGETIAIMHLLGSSDNQIARLFQRRIALDAMLGCVAGFGVALAVMAVVGTRIGALGSDLLGGASLGLFGWLLILLLPVAGTALAAMIARLTVLRTLGKTL
jgi:cell division transport system permease protein